MKKTLLLLLSLVVITLLPIPHQTRTNAFPNEGKHHAMLRLEDVGPGGSYATLDDLGKLRAVFEYLHEQHVPFHVATISRSISISQDGTRYEKGIDDPMPDETVKRFIQVLQNAQKSQGALLGMHGYTHQYGNVYRTDAWQNTGAGFEFDVKDAPETATTSFAVERITKSLAAFEKAGLIPNFWESPHYNDNREQEEIFRSFMGILYQPDFHSLRSLKDLNVYEDVNPYGRASLGSVYVPAPLRYIQDAASVDAVLNKLNTYSGLGAMYYHPFLEFPLLESVTGPDGKPVLQDGIPLYRYKAGTESNLHRLVNRFREHGYNWVTIHDVVPFSPAHRIDMPLGTDASDILIGNVSGSGSADVVITRPDGEIEVFQGDYRWPRNRQQKTPREWLRAPFAAGEQLMLADANGDGVQDLLAWNQTTGLVRAFASTRVSFTDQASAVGTLPVVDQVWPLKANDDGYTDLLTRHQQTLSLALNDKGRIGAPQSILQVPEDAVIHTADFDGDTRDDLLCYAPQDHKLLLYKNAGNGKWPLVQERVVTEPKANAQILVTDTNGDGRADVVLYDAKNGIWEVLQSADDHTLQPIDNLYGPWAAGERVGLTADFDGNGKGDIASYDPVEQTLDISLSFRK